MEPSALLKGKTAREELREAWQDMWEAIHKTSPGLRDYLSVNKDALRAEWAEYSVCVEVVSAPSGFFLEVRIDNVFYRYNHGGIKMWIRGHWDGNTFVPTEVQGVIYQYDSSVVVSDAYARLRGG